MKKADILLVIPLMEEFEALKRIAAVTLIDLKDTVYYYAVEFDNVDYRIVAIILGMPGINNASSMTEKAIDVCKPSLIVLAGLAGGLHRDVGLGDVIIADKVNQFLMDSRAESDGESFSLSFSGYSSDIPVLLVNFARHFSNIDSSRFEQWQKRVSDYKRDYLPNFSEERVLRCKEKAELLIGRIASGDTVGASKAYAAMVLSQDRKYLALEMEAAGVIMAAKNRQYPIPVLAMRGISDLVNEQKEELDSVNGGAIRKYALCNVFDLLVAFLGSQRFRELGMVRGRKALSEKTVESHSQAENESLKLSIVYLSPITERIKSLLEIILEDVELTPEYFHLMPPQESSADNHKDEFVFWILSENQTFFTWNHKVGIELLEQYRKNYVVLAEKCEIPEQLNVFHKVDFSQPSKIHEQLDLLKNRMFTLIPEIHTNDLFVQAISEELTMGKAEYSKKFPQLDKDANIFATMYISAQCQETEELLSYLYKLSRTLPNSSFANLAFGQSTRKKFKEIVKFLTEIMDLIDIGLNIKPNDSVGRSIKLRCQEIIRMIEDEILPSVEMHLGNKGIPDGLGIQVHDVYTIMNGLSSSLNLLRNSIQRVFLESE